MSNSFPKLLDYIDAALWLQAVLSFKRQKSPRFSLRSFGEKLGIKNSGSVSAMLSGKRKLPLDLVARISNEFKLDTVEKCYLSFLFAAQGGLSSSTRRRVQTIFRAQRAREKTPREKPTSSETGINWLEGIIFNAISLDSIDGDKEKLIASFKREDQTSARAAIAKLVRSNSIKEKDGRLEPLLDRLHYGDVGREWVRQYHRESILRSLDTLEKVSTDKRHFQGTSININHKSLSILFGMIESFHDQLLELGLDPKSEGVYQFNSQLFPAIINLQG